MKEGKKKHAKRELWHSLPYAIVFGWVVANYEEVAAEDSTWAMFSVFFLFCLLGQSFIAWRLLLQARWMQPRDLAMERDAYAFGEWAFEHIWNSLKVSRFTPALFGVWLLVAWAQFFSWVVHDDYSVAINNAGVLPAAVFEGQWWRFATAVHISTGVLPIIPAIGVLLFYGTLMEAFLGRTFVPIVFSVSATAGLCLGLFFADPPTGFTAGALGLVGCLLVAARQDYRLKRLNHVTSFPLIITFFALASLLFFNWSDSLVNLGGFAAGAGLGHLFSRFKTAVSEKRWFQWAGWLAGGFLLASGIAACVLIIMNA